MTKKKAEKHAEEVTAMSNEELKERLTTLGIPIGPLVPTTRKIYEKKLINLMNKAELQYSTDEDESVGAIAEEVKEEAPPVQKKKEKRGRPKKEASTVQDKFSDDEDEIPIVQNSSSRRRSNRTTKKPVEKVDVDEPITEEPEEQVENGSVPIVVENGTGDADLPPAKEEIDDDEPVAVEEPVNENKVPQADAAPIPWHTIAVVSILVLLLGLIWQQRDQHAQWMTSIFQWLVAQYTPIYNYLVPGVDMDMIPDIEDASLQDETP